MPRMKLHRWRTSFRGWCPDAGISLFFAVAIAIIGTTAIVILASTIMASIGAFFVHHLVKDTSLFGKESLMLEDKRG